MDLGGKRLGVRTSQTRHLSKPCFSGTPYCVPQAQQMRRSSDVLSFAIVPWMYSNPAELRGKRNEVLVVGFGVVG